MKKYLLGLVSGIIITSIISIGANTFFNAKDISYSNDSTEVDNVEDALTEIYESGDALEEDIWEGKTALVNGKLITGKLNLSGTNAAYLTSFRTSGTYNNATPSLTKGKYLINFYSSSLEYSSRPLITGCDDLVKINDSNIFFEGLSGLTQYGNARGSINSYLYTCELNSDKSITLQTQMSYPYAGKSSYSMVKLY